MSFLDVQAAPLSMHMYRIPSITAVSAHTVKVYGKHNLWMICGCKDTGCRQSQLTSSALAVKVMAFGRPRLSII